MLPIFNDIKKYASVIENRLDDDCEVADVLYSNAEFLKLCQMHGANYLLIDDEYKIEIDL